MIRKCLNKYRYNCLKILVIPFLNEFLLQGHTAKEMVCLQQCLKIHNYVQRCRRKGAAGSTGRVYRQGLLAGSTSRVYWQGLLAGSTGRVYRQGLPPRSTMALTLITNSISQEFSSSFPPEPSFSNKSLFK